MGEIMGCPRVKEASLVVYSFECLVRVSERAFTNTNAGAECRNKWLLLYVAEAY